MEYLEVNSRPIKTTLYKKGFKYKISAMARRPHFFESPLFIIAIFLLLTTGMYFAFDFQGEVLDIALTNQYAFLAFGKKGGVTAYEISKAPVAITAGNPEETRFKIRKNLRRYPRLLLPEPIRKSNYETPGITVSVGASGGRIATVNPLKGISVLDATKVDELKLLGSINLAGANSVKIHENLAFVTAGGAGLYVLDISRAGLIRPLYHLDTPGYASNTFLFDAASFMSKYEISVSEQDETVEKKDLTMWVLIADGSQGIRILEIHPVRGYKDLGSIPVPGFTHNLFVWNNIAFIAAGKAGLCLADIINPLRIVSCTPTPGEALDLDEANGKVYVADGNAGLSIFSAGFDITSVKLLGHLSLHGRASSIGVGHGYAYLGSGKWGLFVVDVSNTSRPRLQNVIETPGEADPSLLIQSITEPKLQTDKVGATWKSLLRKTFLMGMLYLFSLALLAQFVLPIRDNQRMSMLDYVLRFIFGRLERLIYIENGRMFRHDSDGRGNWSKIVILDRSSAALVVDSDERIRAIGPGVTFLEPNEKVARTLDLRIHTLMYGPEFDEDPFCDQPGSETEAVFLKRKARREETKAWTQDEVEIVVTLILDVQVQGQSWQKRHRYVFDPVQAYKAMSDEIPEYEDIGPVVDIAQNWQLALQKITIDCWRAHVKEYTFEELFQKVVDHPEVNLGEYPPTNWQRLVDGFYQELTAPRIAKSEANSQPDGSEIESLASFKLLDFGLQVHAARIVSPQFDPINEGRLVESWKKSWLSQAKLEKERIDQVEKCHKQSERSGAQGGFARGVSKPLYGRIQGYGGMVEKWLTLDEAAKLLLDGTRAVSRKDPNIRRWIDKIQQGLGG